MTTEANVVLELSSAGGGPGAGGARPWVHLLPAGTFRGVDGRGPYHAHDLAGIVAASLPDGGRPLALDFNHATDTAARNGGDAPAAGWITALEPRADGLWGKVEWTERGRAAVQGREYRYLSPMFARSPDGTVRRLARASLTNAPNLTELTSLHAKRTALDPAGALDALRTAFGLGVDADWQAVVAAAEQAGKAADDLRDVLDLDAGADWPSVVEAVRELSTSSNSSDPARFVPIELFQQAVAQANRSNAGLTRHAAEVTVNRAMEEGRIFPWMREWALELCVANKPAFDRFEAGIGKSIHSAIGALTADMGDRFKGTPGASAPHPGGDLGAAIDRQFGITPEDRAKFGARKQ